MPSVAVMLYSLYFKLLTRHRLQTRLNSSSDQFKFDPFGITSRPNEEQIAASNPSFVDCVATKDLHIDPFSSLCVRVFLPKSCLSNPNPKSGTKVSNSIHDSNDHTSGGDSELYGGYLPATEKGNRLFRKLPVVLQFHGGGFVSGSNDSVANDLFCRRIAKLCDAIVIAVGYRLAPESKYPAAFEDGFKVLNWLAKQANLAECGKSNRRLINHNQQYIFDGFGAALAEPWLAAHADPSRCVLLGLSCGANIAEYVVRKAVEAGKLLDPVKVVAQVLMYPFFMGSVPTHSEIKLANSYFYDKATCMLAWKLFLPEEEFDLDHPAANPLNPGRETPFKYMPPTLTVVAEHDWMRDRAIAYSAELRKFNIDAPVLEYKDAVHEFATLDILLKTPQALACAEDIAIWVKKYISQRGNEFSY
ncbi:Alpha/beta hydrolase fold-3 [Dillenia turbinata]|uniref:Alpha/beta hydrolase fold-3 n=1 Tax=Dillenia turbinata TaxID=194707 RepID=A0AAN8V7W0_9MAGN